MDAQPINLVFTIVGGLLSAGALGWIKKARLVVFVPRLFSHSNISDKGQIAEISVMNRSFKTEEAIELLLNPAMHYELIRSNNPDALLIKNKLLVPRIGSADDCSVLLQVEHGNFSKSDIVSCSSKETKASIANKFDDIPLTANQRISSLIIFAFFALFLFIVFKGTSHFFGSKLDESKIVEQKVVEQNASPETAEPDSPPDHQGWNIPKPYAETNNQLYQLFVSKKILVSVNTATVKRNTLQLDVSIENKSTVPLNLNMSTSGMLPQENIEYSKRAITYRLILPNDAIRAKFEILVPKEKGRQSAFIDFLLMSPDGDLLKGIRTIESTE